MLHLCCFLTAVNRQWRAGAPAGISSTRPDGVRGPVLACWSHAYVCARHTWGGAQCYTYIPSYMRCHITASNLLGDGGGKTHVWQNHTFPCPVSSGAQTRERCCSQWTMKPSHPPVVLFLFLSLPCTVFKLFFLTKSHLLHTYPSEKRDYAIKNTSVNVTRALGKLFGHYHADSGI